MWMGAKALLLEEYLQNKKRILELKQLPKRYRNEKIEEEILELEKRLKSFSVCWTHD